MDHLNNVEILWLNTNYSQHGFLTLTPRLSSPSPGAMDPSHPGGGGTVHHSRPTNSSITQLKLFFGACDFLLISYCSWAK